MNWIQLFVSFIALVIKIWDAIHEKNQELKKQKTIVAQDGVRALADRDASRFVASLDDIRRMRE